jgi:DNA-binding NarL/FixJ family response regulator
MKRIRLLIADDHTLVLEVLRKLLEDEFDLLGTAEDGHALVRAAEQLRANKEIAALLNVSEKTVDFHKSTIKRELMLTSTAELTQFAIKHHIIGI